MSESEVCARSRRAASRELASDTAPFSIEKHFVLQSILNAIPFLSHYSPQTLLAYSYPHSCPSYACIAMLLNETRAARYASSEHHDGESHSILSHLRFYCYDSAPLRTRPFINEISFSSNANAEFPFIHPPSSILCAPKIASTTGANVYYRTRARFINRFQVGMPFPS